MPPPFLPAQALKVDTMTSLIDERDREVHNIVASINELAQVWPLVWCVCVCVFVCGLCV